MHQPPPPPRWLWFTVVASLAVFASLILAEGHEPPGRLAVHSDPAASAAPTRHLDPSPTFDKHCLLCQQPLY